MRKNSGGKRQAYYQPQVTTGKRRQDRLMVLGGCTHLLVTSVNFAGRWPETEIAGNQEPAHLALPVLTCAGSRPAVFPPLFFAPFLMYHEIRVLHIMGSIFKT